MGLKMLPSRLSARYAEHSLRPPKGRFANHEVGAPGQLHQGFAIGRIAGKDHGLALVVEAEGERRHAVLDRRGPNGPAIERQFVAVKNEPSWDVSDGR